MYISCSWLSQALLQLRFWVMVQYFWRHGNTIYCMQMKIGAAALLQKGTKLKKLSLFANHLGDEGASEIAEALSAGSYVHLQELDMSANNIGTLGVRCLCDVLESQAAPALEVRIPCHCCKPSQVLAEKRIRSACTERPAKSQ